MGYFGNGFALTEAPDWNLLASSIQRSVALRGYRHRSADLWLIDVWTPSNREHWPFTEEVPSNLFRGQTLARKDEEFLESMLVLARHFQAEEQHAGSDLVRNACGIARVVSSNVFCFAGDDEGVDVASTTSVDGISKFRGRFESCYVEYSGGDIVVTPIQSKEDEEFIDEEGLASSQEEFGEIADMPGVTVGPTKTVEGGLPFYGNSVRLWPVGDSAKMLGVGTWDPFLNLDSDYDLEFESLDTGSLRKPQPAGVAQSQPLSLGKPWWRFW